MKKKKKKLLKKVFGSIGTILVLLVGALLTLPILFKDDIVNKVKVEANKTVNAKIDFGNFDLSLLKSFPDFYLSIENIKVDGIEEFQNIQLANIKKVDLVIDLMSVIKGESINVKRVVIAEPVLNTVVLANGKSNFDIVKTDSTNMEMPDDSASSSAFKLELQQFEVSDAVIKYDDKTFPMLLSISDLDFNLKGDFTESITNLKIDGEIQQFSLDYDGVQYINQAKMIMDMLLEMNLTDSKYIFKENNIQINQLALGLDGWIAMPSEAVDMDLKIEAKRSDFKDFLSIIPAEFAKDLDAVETAGNMGLSAFIKGAYIEETYPAFGIDLKIDNARFKYPELPKSVEDIQITAKIINHDGNLDHTVVEVPKFHMQLANNPFDIKLTLKTPISDPFVKAGMQGKIVLNNIKDVIPLEDGDDISGEFSADLEIEGNLSTLENEDYENFKSLGTLHCSNIHYTSKALSYPVEIYEADMVFSPRFVSVEKMNVKLGESDMQAKGRLENFIGYALKDDQVLSGNLVFTSNYMNLNELAGMDEEDVAAAQEDSTLMEVVLIPKNIDFNMASSIKKMLYDELEIENINGSVKIKDEKISTQSASMNMLKGSMVVSGYYESSNPVAPTFDCEMNILDFDLKETVKNFNTVEQMAPLSRFGTGRYSTDMNVKGKLTENMDPVYQSLTGKGKLKTKSIAVEEYTPLTTISKILQYDQLTPLFIKDANISFQIIEGKVFVDPFTTKIDKTDMTISGSNSFDQTIDYVFSFTIPREEFGGKANQAVDGLLAKAKASGVDLDGAINVINVDVTMKGPAMNPKIGTNFKKSASAAKDALKAELDAAKQKAKEALDKKKQELENQAKDEIEKQKQKAKEEIEKQKQKAKEELEKQKEAAKKKVQEEAKKKLKGLLGK